MADSDGNKGATPWHDLHDLIAACESAFAGPSMGKFEDDEDVSHPPTGITFGMIRRARAAHDTLTWDGVIRGK